MTENFKIISVNARGIGSYKKRKGFFQWLKKSKSNVIFLQETHSVSKDEYTWPTQLSGHYIFSHGTSKSKGVAVIFRNIDYKINKIKTDDNGRMILISADIHDKPYNNHVY